MDNYEEKYKKALSWIQGLYKGLHGKTKEEAEEAFPELKNSENKNIPKALLSWFENCEHVYFAGIDTSDIIAWLKEQIEMPIGRDLQSEIDNLSKRYPEVSFAKLSRIAVHIANWQKQQIAKDNLLLPFKEYDNLMDSINRRKRKGYEAGYKQGLVDSKDGHKPTDKIEPKFKVGDWVVYTGYLLKDSGKEIYVMQVASVEDDRYNFTDTSTLCFDSEKDMRPWTIQDAKDGDVLVHNGCTFIFMGVKNGIVQAFEENLLEGTNPVCFGEPDIDNDYHPATKEQRDQLEKAMADAGYTFDFEKKELKKIKQKPTEGSEEDENILNEIILDLKVFRDTNCSREGKAAYQKEIDWLEFLKDRIIPQPKQEWSEEDELHIKELESLVKQEWAIAERENDKDKIHKMSDLSFFLKTLKPQLKQGEQKPTIDIEIPFGAKDSELIEETISIPNGCYVIIKDNRIVIRKNIKQ